MFAAHPFPTLPFMTQKEHYIRKFMDFILSLSSGPSLIGFNNSVLRASKRLPVLLNKNLLQLKTIRRTTKMQLSLRKKLKNRTMWQIPSRPKLKKGKMNRYLQKSKNQSKQDKRNTLSRVSHNKRK